MDTVLNKKRIDWIDLLEFIGMAFVLIYHSTTYSVDFLSDNSPIYYLRYYLRTVLSTCVPLFFFANGYLLLNKSFNLKKHIFKIINLILLTGLWGIIDILFLMPIENEFLSIKDFIVYLWTWHQGWINHLWYMGALICIYVFFPLIKNVYDNKKNVFLYFVIICAILTFGNRFFEITGTIAGSLVLGHTVNLTGLNFFNMFNPLRGIYGYAFVYFCVGGLSKSYIDKLKAINSTKRNSIALSSILISCAGLFGLGIALSKITGSVWDVVWDGYYTIFTFINVIMIFVITLSYSNSKNNILNKFIRIISDNTLGIYFIHPIFTHLFKPIIKSLTFTQNYFACLIYSLLIMLISLVIILLIKKIPVLNSLVDIKCLEKKFCKED